MARPAKYKCNEHYFQQILTSNQAYILGFIWADGSLSRRSGLSISIKESDIEILEFIRKELSSDCPISIYTIRSNSYARLCINRVNIYESLLQLGLGKNKSQNNAPIPSFSESLFPHFLRGLFDGDGSIWFNGGYRANFSGGYDFLVWLKARLENQGIKCNSKIKSRIKGNLNGCSLDITGRENIKNLGRFMYNDNEFRLTRKFELFEKAESLYRHRNNENWKLNGEGKAIKELLDSGLYPTEMSRKLNIGLRRTRRISDIIRQGNYEFETNEIG